MSKQELTDNLSFLAALSMLEQLVGMEMLSSEEEDQVKSELKRRLRPTLILA